jgi:nicotinamide riboside kinase
MSNEQKKGERPLIAVVGPCASGKSLLVRALREREYNAREVVQEHSHVPTMWQRITQPDLLVYLDVSWKVARQRRSMDVKADWWIELAHRLRHARQHADLYIHTDELTPQEILDRALVFLKAVA